MVYSLLLFWSSVVQELQEFRRMSRMQHPKLLTSSSLVTFNGLYTPFGSPVTGGQKRQNEQALLLSLLQDLSATPELLQLLNSIILNSKLKRLSTFDY